MEISNNPRILSCYCMNEKGKQNSKRGLFRVKVNVRGVECECKSCGRVIKVVMTNSIKIEGKTEEKETPIKLIEKELIKIVQSKFGKPKV